MSARIYKAHNPLAGAVGGETGLRVDHVIKTAHEQLRRLQDPMRDSLRQWVDELVGLAGQAAPDLVRVSWLANGVLGVAAACEMEALAKCGGLLGRAVEAMGPMGWRIEVARLYTGAMAHLLDGASKAEAIAVVASLEAMTQRLTEAA